MHPICGCGGVCATIPAQAFLDEPIGTPEIAIAEIVIAERHRQDMGDIAELAGNVVMT
jgi:hypothetical protein